MELRYLAKEADGNTRSFVWFFVRPQRPHSRPESRGRAMVTAEAVVFPIS